MFKVMPWKILTFQIKGARKKGEIFTSVQGYRDYDDVAPVWIAQVGKYSDEDEPFQVGDTYLIRDHFELEEIPTVWDDYKDDPRFALLKKRCEEVDGYVSTAIMSADAFIARVELSDDPSIGGEIELGDGSIGSFFIGS